MNGLRPERAKQAVEQKGAVMQGNETRRPTSKSFLGWGPTFPPLSSLLPPSLMPLARSLRAPRVPNFSILPIAEAERSDARRSWLRRRGPLLAIGAALPVVATGLLVEQRYITSVFQRTDQVRASGSAALKSVEGGGHVRWHGDAVDVIVDESFRDLSEAAVFDRAIEAWRETGAVLPSMSTVPGKDRRVGYDPSGSNENVVVYAPAGWAKAHGALAVTILTFDSSGAIVDADILVNGGGRYFANFDRDESRPNDEAVAFETGTRNGREDEESARKTSRYDLQSVITHELGHFLGLGEDYDDERTTMFASTRPGETHKRVLTPVDSSVVGALYAERSSVEAGQGGCGRARIARGAGPGRPWFGFFVAAVGLRIGAGVRRSRRVLGLGLASLGLFMLLAPPSIEAAADPATLRPDADVQVIGASSRWADGILETSVAFRVLACRLARCPEGDQSAVVLGGTLGGVTQIVGPLAPPQVGDRLAVRLRDGQGLLHRLGTVFRPQLR